MMNIKYLEHCIDCSKHLTDVRYKNQEKENSSTAKIDLKKKHVGGRTVKIYIELHFPKRAPQNILE